MITTPAENGSSGSGGARVSTYVQTDQTAGDLQGDALTELYRVHALSLIRLGYVMLGDRGAAEDVVQDAFAGLHRRWGQLADSSKAEERLASPWIVTVTNIQGSAPVLATFPAVRSCAARYGWPHDPYGPDRPINSFADFVDWVAKPPRRGRQPGRVGGASARA
jgi:hypothetical protein